MTAKTATPMDGITAVRMRLEKRVSKLESDRVRLIEALDKVRQTLGPISIRSTLQQGVRADLRATVRQANALLREMEGS